MARKGRSKRKKPLPAKVAKLSPKNLRFGKRVRRRGKYRQEIRDQHNKLVGTVPWNQKVKAEVRSVLKVKRGVGTKRDRQRLGVEVPGWFLVSYDRALNEAVWIRNVWEGTGVPIGEPGGRVRGRRQGRAGRWLGAVMEAVTPSEWVLLLRQLPSRLKKRDGSNFMLRLTVLDADGVEHRVTDPTAWLVQGLTRARHFRAMLAAACSRAAKRFGYAGAVELLAVDILMGGQAA